VCSVSKRRSVGSSKRSRGSSSSSNGYGDVALILWVNTGVQQDRIGSLVVGSTIAVGGVVVHGISMGISSVSTAVHRSTIGDVSRVAGVGTARSGITVLYLAAMGVRRLAGDRRRAGEAGAGGCRSDGENIGLPALTLTGLLLELSSLGGDSSRELDVLEHRVLGGNSDVGALVGDLGLGLLLTDSELLLEGLVVAVVDVLSMLGVGVVFKLSLDTLLFLVDAVTEGIQIVEGGADLLLESLDDDGLQDLEEKGLEDTEQHLVLGFLELDVQVADIDLAGVDLEEAVAAGLVGGGQSKLEAESLASEEDVHNTEISDRGETLLATDVVRDISKIALDSRGGDHNLLTLLRSGSLTAKSEVGVVFNLKHVRHQVIRLNNQVLNDSIKLLVGVLNARNRNIANTLKDIGKDHVGDILDQVLLEGRLSILIISEVLEQTIHGISQTLVVGISSELLAHKLKFVDQAVSVVPVAVAEQEVAVVVETVVLVGRSRLHDVTLLLEAAADELVHVTEPILKLGITVGIGVDVVDSIDQIIGGGVVSEPLDEDLQRALGRLEVVVTVGILDLGGRLVGEVLSVSGVGLGKFDQSVDGLVVILVSLDLDNHLLQPPDSLVTTLLGHLGLEVVLGAFTVLAGLVLLVFGNVGIHAVGKVVDTSSESLDSVDSGPAVRVVGCTLSGVTGVAGVVGVSSLGGIAGYVAELVARDRLIAVHLLTHLVLEVVAREVGSVVPLVVGSRLVHLTELVLGGADLSGGLGGGIAGDVAEEEGGIGEELAKFSMVRLVMVHDWGLRFMDSVPVCNNQPSQGLDSLQALLSINVCLVLADGSIRSSGCRYTILSQLGGVPDKLLQRLVMVLE
jgi:hypothetical protein